MDRGTARWRSPRLGKRYTGRVGPRSQTEVVAKSSAQALRPHSARICTAAKCGGDYKRVVVVDWTLMLYVFVRGAQRKTCETRLSADGAGYELVIAEDGVERIDRYATMDRLLAREHELLQAWRAQGWAEPQGKR